MDDTSTWMKSQFSMNHAASVSVIEGLSQWKSRFLPPCYRHSIILRAYLACPNAFSGLFSRWISMNEFGSSPGCLGMTLAGRV